MLSDKDIKKSLKNNEIEISPLDEDYIQPSSVDLRVGSDFRVFENHKYSHIDPKAQQDDLTTLVTASQNEPFVLHPGEFVLGTTYEKVTLSNKVVARLEGKSSLGRIGLLIHSTAGFVDPGFSGYLTLELSNVANLPIKIYPEMKILVVAVFPRRRELTHPHRKEIIELNSYLPKLLKDIPNVSFIDIGPKFLDAKGHLSKEMMPDTTHPSTRGHEIWAEAIVPTLKQMMGKK